MYVYVCLDINRKPWWIKMHETHAHTGQTRWNIAMSEDDSSYNE